MAASFFFYDLETTGIDPRQCRIMQFAGIRTDVNLNQVGEPVNLMIKLSPDVLPDPDAIMITGITPQQTLLEGLTEAEFLRYFYDEVVQPDTCFVGYNTVRFDDEFMRSLLYRNFYDPYEWQWQNGCSRWDLLDVVRMTRALRPDGVEWPVTDEGKPTNRLELLTVANKLEHEKAHDALSDVYATIAVAKLIKDKQPDLFTYLHDRRSKKNVAEVIDAGQPFMYTSGRYPATELHTTAVIKIASHGSDAVVYNLRHDPTPFLAMSPEEMVDAWRYKKDRPDDFVRLPVKTVKYNRCPAVAPIGVIKDQAVQQRINLTLDTVQANLAKLQASIVPFTRSVLAAIELLDNERARQYPKATTVTATTVDSMLYDGFFEAGNKQIMSAVRAAEPTDIAAAGQGLSDARLQQLLPLYKARNYPATLTDDERSAWDAHLAEQLYQGGQASRLARYFARLQELAAGSLTSQQEYLLEELQLYGESVMPSDGGEG